MRSSILLPVLGAAVAMASPAEKIVVVTDIDVVTVTDIVYINGPAPTPVPSVINHDVPSVFADGGPRPSGYRQHHSHRSHAAPSTFVTKTSPAAASSTSTPVPEMYPTSTLAPPVSIPVAPVPSSSAAPSPSPATTSAPSSTDGSPMSGDHTILSIINKYRARYSGLNPMKWSTKLVANAQKTTDYDVNVSHNMTHELNPGSMGQVLSPGFANANPQYTPDGFTPFEMTYLSWLCESSGDAQLSAADNNGVALCDLIMYGKPGSLMNMVYGVGQLGHYEVLIGNKDYTEIGCAFTQNPDSTSGPYQGYWGCDTA